MYGQKPAPDKKKNNKLRKIGKSELTLTSPQPMVYRVKNSLHDLESAQTPRLESSNLIEKNP